MVSPCVYCTAPILLNLRKRSQKVYPCPSCGGKNVVKVVETLQDNLFDGSVKKKRFVSLRKVSNE